MNLSSLNIRKMRILALGMALLPHVAFSTILQTTYAFSEEPPAPYDEQWGRLVDAFTICEYYKEEYEEERAAAPRYGKRYARACQHLKDTLSGSNMDKKDVVNQRINKAYYMVCLAQLEAVVIWRQNEGHRDHELRHRRALRKLEEKAIQEGFGELVKSETIADKKRMFELQQERDKELFEWKQEKAKKEFEEELQKQQEAADQNKQ
jgi:hypothetical protein